jgi:hypothetical protein
MVPITYWRTCFSGEYGDRMKNMQNPGMFCLGKLILRCSFPLSLSAFRQKLGKGYNRIHILGW